MSEAVGSNHNPNLRLPKPTKKKIPVKQELTPQQSDNAVSGDGHEAISGTTPVEIADWQPVKFPDTINLAELSRSESSAIAAESSAVNLKDSPSEDSQAAENLVHQLQQENSAFRAQVGQLERDLTQAQVELQLEVTRFYCKESEAAAIPQSDSRQEIAAQSPLNSQELTAIHQQISQLSQELDSSQKMGHRQQILVETLSEQLESGQERIAHLERDCAITQQRYNEQVQLVLQAENVCRDLRMRLHRQQRQALQFKAALEKSLEMEAMQGEAIAHSDPISSHAADATPFIPKVQPVQPWSQETAADSRTYTNCRGEEHGLLNLFSKLLMADQQPVEGVEITPIQEVELASIQMLPQMLPSVNQVINRGQSAEIGGLVQLDQPLPVPEVITPEDVFQSMGMIFPKQVDSSSQSSAIALAAEEAVFDLSPFLDAGDAEVFNAPKIELRPIAKNVLPPLLHPPRPKQAAIDPAVDQKTSVKPADSQPQVLSQSGDREDNLWADLAKLIEPDSTVEAASMPELSNQAVERSPLASNPFQLADSVANDAVVENEGISDKKPAKKTKSDRSTTPKPLSLDFFAYIEKKATDTPNANISNIEALNSAPQPVPESANAHLSHFEKKIEKKTAAPEDTLEPSPSLPRTTDSKPNTCPSPLLYPFRPAKKLSSMSAIDLPSFRHAAN